MVLRHALMPPVLDEAKVRFLAALASKLDGAPSQGMNSGGWEGELAEFNRVAETDLLIDDFQGIYKAEEHDRWVRRTLVRKAVRPITDVTREELVEVVRRATPNECNLHDHEAYMAVFEANVPLQGASNLIFYPPDYDARTNTWDNGRPICDYNPTPEQIVDWALTRPRQ